MGNRPVIESSESKKTSDKPKDQKVEKAGETLKKAGTSALWAEAIGIGTQQGLKLFRGMEPLNTKINLGNFSKFSPSFSTVGKISAMPGYVGALASVGADYIEFKEEKISFGRLSYRTAGSGASLGIAVGAASAAGGPVGLGAGLLVQGAFWAGEKMYDGTMMAADEIARQASYFENVSNWKK